MGFVRRFTEANVALLAQTDALHGSLSGPATRHLMQRAHSMFGEARCARLATISVAHMYNLRKRAGYLARRQVWTKTRSEQITIGERRAPAPDGRPGFIRIERVHQGDQEGLKGVYHCTHVRGIQLAQWHAMRPLYLGFAIPASTTS